jgi:hypothetical protein
MRLFSFLSDILFKKKLTPAQWAKGLSNQELLGFYIAGPQWTESHEFDAIMDEMEQRQIDIPHISIRW